MQLPTTSTGIFILFCNLRTAATTWLARPVDAMFYYCSFDSGCKTYATSVAVFVTVS